MTGERWRRPSKDGGPSAIGRPGPVERVTVRRDRAIALFEDIWREKIRGCSYRKAARATQCPPPIATKFLSAAK
jgi:hypothetical protein